MKNMDIEEITVHTNNKELFEIYSQIILNLIAWIALHFDDSKNIKTNFGIYLNKLAREGHHKNKNILFKKNILVNVYRKMLANKQLIITDKNNMWIDTLKVMLQKKPSRNISGITSITLLTSPHPNGQSFSCQHNCYYCPNEPAHKDNNFQDQPRSYLYNEPAVRRANQNGFLAINQMISRLDVLFMNGHEIDKLEIILEGGTYTEYPPDYLELFHRDIFFVANTYFEKTQTRKPLSIAEEILINKTSNVHIIGICIETRPDSINDIWIRRFRNWGVTRIQIGVQHTDNTILKRINRGHTIEQVHDCIKYLKDNCFKIDIHAMPDLPFSTPQLDKSMFDYIYTHIHPDQMKIYPCEVTPWTVIEQWYKTKKYIPYSEVCMRDLFEVIKYGMITCPAHIRLPRVIRDIPNTYIQAGNTHANLRQLIDLELEKEKLWSMDIRNREIGRHPGYYKLPAEYTITKFEANGGIEHFIQYQSIDKKVIFGFIRLRFPGKDHSPVFPVLKNKALIRELHVYGNTNVVGKSSSNGAQHNGIGSKLLVIAEKEARKNGYKGIVVISGEGVKGYYEKRGYIEIDTFMIKELYWFNLNLQRALDYFRTNSKVNFIYEKLRYTISMILISIICYNIGYYYLFAYYLFVNYLFV